MKQTLSIPSDAISVYNNALILSNRGLFQNALDEYRKAITIFPKFLEAYNNIGEIYSKLGDTDKAITTYLQALSIERNYKVLLNLGVEYYNDGKYKAALTHFKESVTKKDDFLEGLFYAGMAFFNLKEYKDAEYYFVKVLDIDLYHVRVNYLLSYIYYEWKNYNQALVCLERILNISDDKVFVHKYYGFCLFHLGRYDDAVKYLTTALQSSPQYEKFKGYLMSLTVENKMKEIGDVKKKIHEMEQIMMSNIQPSLGEYTKLSMLYIFNGEYNKAEEILVGYKKSIA